MTVRAPEVLTGARVLSLEEVERYQALSFGPNAASRTLDLPRVTDCQGVIVMIANLSTTAGATLVVRDAAGATVLTVPIAAAGTPKSAILWCDGTAWYGHLGA